MNFLIKQLVLTKDSVTDGRRHFYEFIYNSIDAVINAEDAVATIKDLFRS